jgi:hypothetical protein
MAYPFHWDAMTNRRSLPVALDGVWLPSRHHIKRGLQFQHFYVSQTDSMAPAVRRLCTCRDALLLPFWQDICQRLDSTRAASG